MPDKTDVLARLRDPRPDGPADRLAALIVADVLGRSIRELVDAKAAAASLAEGIRALTASDAAEANVIAALEHGARELAAHNDPIETVIPDALQSGLRALVQLPAAPKREAIMKLLDREPIKKLLRAQVIDTLIAFGKKAASPVADSSIARGIGGLSKLAFGQLASRPSPLGSIASAVSNEVERQMEKRATDFADTAVGGILEGLADQVSDPARAAEQAAVRLAVLEGILALTGADIAALGGGSIPGRVQAARKSMKAWAASATFAADIEAGLALLLARDGDRSVREILTDLAIVDVVEARARTVVRERITAIAEGDAFATWLGELLA
jgi:hypothetical protein